MREPTLDATNGDLRFRDLVYRTDGSTECSSSIGVRPFWKLRAS